MMSSKPEPLHWLDGSRGQYIPQAFAQSMGDDGRSKAVMNVSREDWAVLDAGPDHADYWDVWNDVEQKAEIVFPDNNAYRLYQDGDLWLVPVGMAWSEDADGFIWPKEQLI